MSWSKYISKNPIKSIAVPTFFNLLQFGANIVIALSDGQIDSMEFHQLLSTASGLETVILAGIMFALKKNKK